MCADVIDASVSGSNSFQFRRIMDDHFDHYKRPPSREPSVDKLSAAARGSSRNSSRTRLNEASAIPLPVVVKPPPQQQQPTQQPQQPSVRSLEEPVSLDYSKTNGGPPSLLNQQTAGLKYRGGAAVGRPEPASQTIDNTGGAIPKRTESLYFKPFQDEQSSGKVTPEYQNQIVSKH